VGETRHAAGSVDASKACEAAEKRVLAANPSISVGSRPMIRVSWLEPAGGGTAGQGRGNSPGFPLENSLERAKSLTRWSSALLRLSLLSEGIRGLFR